MRRFCHADEPVVSIWAAFPPLTVVNCDLKWVLLRGDLGAREIENLKSVGFALNGYVSSEASGFLQWFVPV
jgi:hypothetical protein